MEERQSIMAYGKPSSDLNVELYKVLLAESMKEGDGQGEEISLDETELL